MSYTLIHIPTSRRIIYLSDILKNDKALLEESITTSFKNKPIYLNYLENNTFYLSTSSGEDSHQVTKEEFEIIEINE